MTYDLLQSRYSRILIRQRPRGEAYGGPIGAGSAYATRRHPAEKGPSKPSRARRGARFEVSRRACEIGIPARRIGEGFFSRPVQWGDDGGGCSRTTTATDAPHNAAAVYPVRAPFPAA